MTGPNVHFIKALWGMESTPQPKAFEMIKAAGYEGFETPTFNVTDKKLVKDSGLEFVGMVFPMTIDELKAGIDHSVEFGAVLINVHAGKDWWSHEKGEAFFEEALKIKCPVQVCYEGHRGRILFNPSTTAHYLRKFPDLRITADISHWTNVCESLLDDQAETMELCINRTGYIHARVGHEEGPQVPDPRVPQWQGHVERFEKWWDAIRLVHHEKGDAILRVDVEFGPPNYMWTNPADGKPAADLWDVCLYMRDRLKKRWS